MNNVFTLIFIILFSGLSILIGTVLSNRPSPVEKKAVPLTVPHIGRIEILNGCGIEGAANKVADFLRSRNFDVKNIGNAQTWNYPYTMVISRSLDTTVAFQVSNALKTDKRIIMRNNENMYDVTVIIGPDFTDRIK